MSPSLDEKLLESSAFADFARQGFTVAGVAGRGRRLLIFGVGQHAGRLLHVSAGVARVAARAELRWHVGKLDDRLSGVLVPMPKWLILRRAMSDGTRFAENEGSCGSVNERTTAESGAKLLFSLVGVIMKSILKFVGAVALGSFATVGVAMAGPNLVPEPGSIALVGLAVGALVVASRGSKK
ncbi:PEP-CTERM sorting domain-containing protein [Ideonella sp. DXS22W]|uniref:PEP-CTERM sorting domain-containing protein n=1 Tax=Pseudaquabacterium inlustre TaxID=2984192 RepID=A0ABU9CSE0_9BURK